MIIRTSIREPMALPKGDESHLLVQESNDKKLGRIVTRQCSNRVTYQLSINIIGVAAGFQNNVETDQVALDIDIRMIDRVADAGLRGQIDYDGGLVYCKYFVDKGLIGDTSFNKDVPDGRVDRIDHAKAVLLELRVVVIIHVVEADHSAACEFAAQAHNQVCADKAGGAGDQDGFAVQIDGSLAHCLFLVGVIVAGNRSIAVSISAEDVSCIDFFLDIV